ncbi:sulfhydryl oxidase 2-like isoform X2 [Cynara cardunculus var. scolymus]|uniref:sulfhydryl oxidase 2-like isoform X2 n=1 Tax=Cynara cardunculus var. scolymus TaxID=59895 RepID=UPI000D630BA5|nr:sulfhydryl oxidase 2-like isoform X2 [Cynara cardunculus var. scolymus]
MFHLLTTLLIFWSFDSSSLLSSAFPIFPTVGSRSILRAIKRSDDQPGCVVDLNATNFDAVLKETPATYAIVEFFAHWCPACRNYKPQYEKVARLFNGADAVHPGIILMTQIDCANKVNTNLCRKFHISHYPMLLWGPPSKFIAGRRNGKQEKGEIHPIEDGKTADLLLKWINTQLGSSYGLEDEKFENDKLLQSNVSDPGQIARAIYDVEEALTVAFDIILEHKMIKSDTRATLIKFLQVMVAHHPSRRCRKGSADILVNFDDLYPSNISSVNKEELNNSTGLGALRTFQICGKQVPRGYWMFCRGSKNDTRGFSCGLWVLLHSLSVRVDDGESQLAFTAACDFIHKFFICEECSQHFYEMCSSVSSPFNRTHDFVLWLWTAHNKVNERLMKTEASLGTGDPKFPKIIWPPNQLCPTCYAAENVRTGNNWDHDEVFKFLVRHYGKMLVSHYEDKEIMSHVNVKSSTVSEDLVGSTNALVVPMGAAVAIALASCLFGAVAYVWRSRQKNRKPRRSWS